MVGIHRVLIADITIDGDAAANSVAVTLRHHVRGHRSQRRHQLQ